MDFREYVDENMTMERRKEICRSSGSPFFWLQFNQAFKEKEQSELEQKEAEVLRGGQAGEVVAEEKKPEPVLSSGVISSKEVERIDSEESLPEGARKSIQTFENIFGKNYSSEVPDMIGSKQFDDEQKVYIEKTEVHLKPNSYIAKKVASKAVEKTGKNIGKLVSRIKNGGGSSEDKKILSVQEKLASLDLNGWIGLSNSVFKAIPAIVTTIDFDIRRIALSSGFFSKRGSSTFTQLQTIIELKDQKQKLLNLYVLNKMFAALIRTPLERQVFLCVMVKEKSMDTVEGQKLRTLYRMRRDILARFREFCLRRGYDARWFYEHFSTLPAVRYAAENFDFERKVRELQFEKFEEKYDKKDVLDFLEGNNIEGV